MNPPDGAPGVELTELWFCSSIRRSWYPGPSPPAHIRWSTAGHADLVVSPTVQVMNSTCLGGQDCKQNW